MEIIEYRPDLPITNLEHLPRGMGAPYLEVMHGLGGALVAAAWRRTMPESLPSGRALVKFKPLPRKRKG